MNDIQQVVLNSNQLQSIAKDILDQAKRCGATQAEVSIAENKGFSVSARDGDVETVEYNQDKSIHLIVFIDQRRGSASLSDIREEAVRFQDLQPVFLPGAKTRHTADRRGRPRGGVAGGRTPSGVSEWGCGGRFLCEGAAVLAGIISR